MTFVPYLPPPARLCDPSPGTLRITLSNSDQGRRYCEADLVAGSGGTAVGVVVNETGSRNVLRRVAAWLSEFGAASATLELDGGTYEMTRS